MYNNINIVTRDSLNMVTQVNSLGLRKYRKHIRRKVKHKKWKEYARNWRKCPEYECDRYKYSRIIIMNYI